MRDEPGENLCSTMRDTPVVESVRRDLPIVEFDYVFNVEQTEACNCGYFRPRLSGRSTSSPRPLIRDRGVRVDHVVGRRPGELRAV